MRLTIEYVQQMSASRSARWHNTPDKEWTVLEVAGAMCGEAGEVGEAVELIALHSAMSSAAGRAANVAKKMRRVELGIEFRNDVLNANLDAMLARECADTFLYLVLLCTKRGINLEDAVRDTFNRVSLANGFPEVL